MRYMDSLRFIFGKETWFSNTLICVVCLLIPVIGPIVMLGYMYVVFDSIHQDPKRKDYPEFKFDRFTEFLTRGIWPFLVQLIAQALTMAPMFVMYLIAVVVSAAAAKDAPFLIVLAWLAYVVVGLALGITVAVVMWPAQLHSGYGRQLDFGGMIGFIKDFFKKVRKELILSILFLLGAGIVLVFLGFLALCIGTWFVAVILTFAQYHLKHQLYALYLERGGQPIPVKGGTSERRPEWPESGSTGTTEPPSGGQSTGIQADPPKS